jgi:hypothetical protein
MNVRRITFAVAAAAAAVVTTAGSASAATTTEVYASDLGGHWHTADTRPAGSLTWTGEYGGALGDGAVLLSTPTSGAKVQLFTDEFDGTRLEDITELSYATYQVSAPGAGVALPALNMRIDRDDDGDVDAYLVYEPYQDQGNDAIEPGVWQTWDAWQGGQAQWWSGQIAECPQASPCTIDTLLETYPDAVILEDTTSLRAGSTPADADFAGAIGFNQGSGNSDTVGAADALHIATSAGVDVTYDFEAGERPVRLSGKNDCKNGGWKTSDEPVFRNQGDCVSHFSRK